MDDVEATVEIDAPAQVVWDACMDPHRTTEWVTIVRGVSDVDSGELRVGFKMGQTMRLRGVDFTVKWELVECDAPRFARWEGRGPARSKAFIEDILEELPGGGTRLTYRNAFKTPLGPLGAVAGKALVGGIPEREAKASLLRLKALLEG